MITPELIAYIKSELGKGKTREDIRVDLLASGGWTDIDLSEAFRSTMPMDNLKIPQPVQPIEPLPKPPAPLQNPIPGPVVISPDSSFPTTSQIKKPPRKIPWVAITLAILFAAICFFAFYFYSPQILDLPNKVVSVIDTLMDNTNNEILEAEAPIVQDETPVPLITDMPPYINCGITISPNRNDSSTYLDDNVFKCLGESALSCENAEAIINDTILPTIFKIKKDGDVCRFELSYKEDSSLTDIFGRKLSGRDISCPVTVAKSFTGIDSQDFIFKNTDITKPSRYGADMYFYGTVGIFFDQDFKQEAIEELGCRGTFLDSAIESFGLIKSKI